jgi:hypothetical protein
MMAHNAGTLRFAKLRPAGGCGSPRFISRPRWVQSGLRAGPASAVSDWTEAPLSYSFFAAVHCMGGDLLIAGRDASARRYSRAGSGPARAIGASPSSRQSLASATPFCASGSTWRLRGNWSYAPAMPRLPWLGTGLSPILESAFLPPLAFVLLRRLMPLGAPDRPPSLP